MKKSLRQLIKPLIYPRPWEAPKVPGDYLDAKAASTGATPPGGKPESPGTFITPSSLATFTGATVGIVTLTTFIGVLVPALQHGQPRVILTAVCAFAVGGVLFWLSVDEPQSRPKRRAQWAMAILVAFINTAYLTTSSLGIPLVFDKLSHSDSSSTDQKPPPPTTNTPPRTNTDAIPQ